MPRLGNPLVYDLLKVADVLTQQKGTPNLRKASMRRAVSTAYYAVFHALCFLCADELVSWSKGDIHEPIYRSVDHGLAKKRLAGRPAGDIGPTALAIGAAFTRLQEERHLADYAAPRLTVSRERTEETVSLAKQTIDLIEGLDGTERLKLAILLVAKQRVG